MTSPRVVALTDRYGITLSERCARGNYVYDGVSIALRRDPQFRYSAHAVLHDICHWFIADSWQRDLPEFGLMVGVADEYADASDVFSHSTTDLWLRFKAEEGLLDRYDQNIQEVATQKLCCLLGPKLDISSDLYGLKLGSWSAYARYKELEGDVRPSVSGLWTARCVEQLVHRACDEFSLLV